MGITSSTVRIILKSDSYEGGSCSKLSWYELINENGWDYLSNALVHSEKEIGILELNEFELQIAVQFLNTIVERT